MYGQILCKRVAELTTKDKLWNPYTREFRTIAHLELLYNVPITELKAVNGAVGYSTTSHPIIRNKLDVIGTKVTALVNGNTCVTEVNDERVLSTVVSTKFVGFGTAMLITLTGDERTRIYTYGNHPDTLIDCHNNKPASDDGNIV